MKQIKADFEQKIINNNNGQLNKINVDKIGPEKIDKSYNLLKIATSKPEILEEILGMNHDFFASYIADLSISLLVEVISGDLEDSRIVQKLELLEKSGFRSNILTPKYLNKIQLVFSKHIPTFMLLSLVFFYQQWSFSQSELEMISGKSMVNIFIQFYSTHSFILSKLPFNLKEEFVKDGEVTDEVFLILKNDPNMVLDLFKLGLNKSHFTKTKLVDLFLQTVELLDVLELKEMFCQFFDNLDPIETIRSNFERILQALLRIYSPTERIAKLEFLWQWGMRDLLEEDFDLLNRFINWINTQLTERSVHFQIAIPDRGTRELIKASNIYQELTSLISRRTYVLIDWTGWSKVEDAARSTLSLDDLQSLLGQKGEDRLSLCQDLIFYLKDGVENNTKIDVGDEPMDGDFLECCLCAQYLIEDLQPIIKTICGHFFHQNCFDPFIEKRRCCPLDNKRLVLDVVCLEII